MFRLNFPALSLWVENRPCLESVEAGAAQSCSLIPDTAHPVASKRRVYRWVLR